MDDNEFVTQTTADYDDDNASMIIMPPCNMEGISNFGKYFLPPFYIIIFIVSILGNGLVLFIIYKFEKLNTVNNILLINLVASDLVFTLSLPFQAIYHSSEWTFGSLGCKLMNTTYFLGFYSSVLFLTLITFDRYLAVVHVVAAAKQRQSCYAFAASTVIWIISAVASLETYFNHDVEDDIVQGLICGDTSDPDFRVFGPYALFAMFFVFPLVITLYCYIRIGLRVISSRMKSKHRPLKLIFTIVVLFFMCWTPYNVILLMKEIVNEGSCDYSLVYPQYITHNIANLYFCINPIFYTFLGRKFQNHVRQLLVTRLPCLKDHITVSTSIRSYSR
ncbi:C-C chemokine receptor type 4-like [Trichomycterus rosablanca]|uniref:C-C chemokine receptor type 4-like n=1 Tax=Trichomycterus rosablanca TaxID=2290929 RepID=UPI002F3610D1